jgi:thiosulfate/3-mercaptopyruvate sulfurtransferase
MKKLIFLFLMMVVLMIGVTGCTAGVNSDLGSHIISAEDALERVAAGAWLVDAQNNAEAYQEGHVVGAVSITRDKITTSEPVSNSLIDLETFEEVMGAAGIANDTEVIIYDNNKTMDSGRLFWTMVSYGHENVKVVSGGLQALIDAGAATGTESPTVTSSAYTGTPLDMTYYASIDDVIDQLNYPDPNTVILDTRTPEEFEAGTIPTSILIPFTDNLYEDGTMMPAQQIRIMYKKAGIEEDDTIIAYCKTSVRAAQTFVALKSAGYENVKVYDGAYTEWSSDPALPVQMPEGEAAPVISNVQDAS